MMRRSNFSICFKSILTFKRQYLSKRAASGFERMPIRLPVRYFLVLANKSFAINASEFSMVDITRRQALAALGCFGASVGLSGCGCAED
jgi:hypothetical protein